jgi:hypothetical protein
MQRHRSGARLRAERPRQRWWRARRINLHDGVLHERLRAHKLVVGGVVDDVQDTRLARAHLRTPREVARVQAHRTELRVAAAHAHGVHTLGANLRHRHLPAHLILALLVVDGLFATGKPALVQAATSDTHAAAAAAVRCWGPRPASGSEREAAQTRPSAVPVFATRAHRAAWYASDARRVGRAGGGARQAADDGQHGAAAGRAWQQRLAHERGRQTTRRGGNSWKRGGPPSEPTYLSSVGKGLFSNRRRPDMPALRMDEAPDLGQVVRPAARRTARCLAPPTDPGRCTRRERRAPDHGAVARRHARAASGTPRY